MISHREIAMISLEEIAMISHREIAWVFRSCRGLRVQAGMRLIYLAGVSPPPDDAAVSAGGLSLCFRTIYTASE
jgi:hypothetical protein